VPQWLVRQPEDAPGRLWRYHEVLPLNDLSHIVSLGEGGTPLIKSRALAASLGLKNLYIKDERQGPTGSFKDRQATVALSVLREMGVDELVVASTGNVAISYAAYARAGRHQAVGVFPQPGSRRQNARGGAVRRGGHQDHRHL
jgi:threonine synthase